jgi:hypothetical protein
LAEFIERVLAVVGDGSTIFIAAPDKINIGTEVRIRIVEPGIFDLPKSPNRYEKRRMQFKKSNSWKKDKIWK